MTRVVFHFGDVDYDHVVGDPGCGACWLDEAEPHDCGTLGCLDHTQFGDENANGDYWLFHLGDLCRQP